MDAAWIKILENSGAIAVLAYLIFLNSQKDKLIFSMLGDFTKLLQKISDALESVKEELRCMREKEN